MDWGADRHRDFARPVEKEAIPSATFTLVNGLYLLYPMFFNGTFDFATTEIYSEYILDNLKTRLQCCTTIKFEFITKRNHNCTALDYVIMANKIHN